MLRHCLVATLLFLAAPAFAEDSEPSAILELGPAASWGLKGGSAWGPSLGAEVTPIPDVLELEGGISTLFSRGQTEWDADFLFKKPWTLSDTVEFMAGIGPGWTHTVTHSGTTDQLTAEAALDFMFWPWPSRKYGLYLEPSYEYGFGHDHEQSLGLSLGLLIPIP